MLRQSAPAAAGLRRGDSSRLAFLHHLARGVSEPQGFLAACWPGGPPDSCLGGWWFCFIYSALASGSPCAEEKKETNCGECGGEQQTEGSRAPAGRGRGAPRRRSRGEPSTAPAPRQLRAPPIPPGFSTFLSLFFFFFPSPPFLFFLPLFFFSISPSLPSLSP